MKTELENKKRQYAVIKMPDGSVIRGPCGEYYIYTAGWAKVEINGIWYKCDQSRIVIWEE